MAAYYNEFDAGAAEWLRELIKAGHVAPGDVDQRSIKEVQPNDLKGYEQVHFFAGIGGWSYALRLAGVADDFQLWTGSCPCQPFSAAGKRKGQADERHLWPEMFRLISQCKPAIVFGEQVPSAIGHGWLDGVFADLEGQDYACGSIVFGSHSVGAPNIRQRLWWLAESAIAGSWAAGPQNEEPESGRSESRREGCRVVGGLADASGSERRFRTKPKGQHRASFHASNRCDTSDDCGLGDTGRQGPQERIGDGRLQPGPAQTNPWETFELASCRDGKARRFEPGSFPLAHGVPARVVRLRGYGNAINPWVAKEFIQAYIEARSELVPKATA